MSGSLSLFPARRRPGVLGGMETRMEQIAQHVDALWKWSFFWREGILPSLAPQGALMYRGNGLLLEGRHSAFPGAARRLSFANAASAPDGAREGRMPSLQGPSQSQGTCPCSLRVGDPASPAGWRTHTEQIAQRVDAPWKWSSSVKGRHSAFPGAARRLSFANAASAPDGAREGARRAGHFRCACHALMDTFESGIGQDATLSDTPGQTRRQPREL